MRIISWNVNGIRSVYKKGFVDFINKTDPDIVCLQEIKSNEVPTSSDLFSQGLENKYFVSINSAKRSGYSGTLVFSKEKPLSVNKNLGLNRFDDEGRILEIKFKNFTLINTYIPHGARDKRNLDYKLDVYKSLIKYLQKRKKEKLIVCGDFNIAHKEIDLARPKGNIDNIMFTPTERKQIDEIIKLGYVDTFRKFNKDGGNYTWWSYMRNAREKDIGWRIDYIFVSKPMEKSIKEAGIYKKVKGSDHCPIYIEINAKT